MKFVLILTVYVMGYASESGVAVNKVAIPEFRSMEACERAGRIEQQGSPKRLDNRIAAHGTVTTTWSCHPLYK